MTMLNTIQQLIENNESRLLMDQQVVFASDLAEAGQLDFDYPMLSSIPTPSDDCCILFSDTNYNGERKWICHEGSP